jgi:2-dehydro-3-deoxyphosphooctonate aldolase (KDO 8-P synthase)
MKELGYPVIYDATHSVQSPGGMDDRSGGERRYIPYLAMASVTCGADAVFMEVHEEPDSALSDGPNMIDMDNLEKLLVKLIKVERAIR